MKTIKEVVKEDVLTPNGHNCFECQPFVKGEYLLNSCHEKCRPDFSKRLDDAWHMEGCLNNDYSWHGTVHCE